MTNKTKVKVINLDNKELDDVVLSAKVFKLRKIKTLLLNC